MLHIVFILLKIIGIILASILGLLVFLLLIILFVPIRYSINANNKEAIFAEVKASWMLRLIFLRISYIDDDFNIIVRIFGKVFYDLKNPKKSKKSERIKIEKEERSTNRIKGNIKKDKQDLSKIELVEIKSTEDVKKTVEIKKSAEIKKTTETKEITEKASMAETADTKKNVNNVTKEEIDITKSSHKEVEIKEIKEIRKSENNLEVERDRKTSRLIQKEEASKENKDGFKESKKGSAGNKETGIGTEAGTTGFSNKVNAFYQKIKEIAQKIKGIIQNLKENSLNLIKKIKDFYLGLKTRIKNIEVSYELFKNKVNRFLDKWHKLKAFFGDEVNQKGIKKAWNGIKHMIKYISPTKCRAKIEFGTGDPYSTGQALTYLAPFYGFYSDWAVVVPNFEDEILEGTITCKGRIRLVTLLIICLKLILDKNFRQLMKNYKVFKEDF